ncbi:LarC family nickel insertion protein [Vagococcus lutrae]|uniref:LarC family nickel insertion protein n=1 Tax=Vagococcus lutrae TaxID=81947 RepID=UPI00288D583F|nr:LarC family nickel insertion protein [Vagococcus lutrae]MDT2811936.1 LarC family nickel insertion protein [Vagococcus lutrae]
MSVLYIDSKYGISGDMTLASLIDLGADIDFIYSELSKLPIASFNLDVRSHNEKGIQSKQLVLTFKDELEEYKPQEQGPDPVGHSHTHEHHEHHHTHSHHHDSHDKEHHHTHSHHKASDILAMIAQSELPERVKERSGDIFKEIARAEAQIHGMSIEDVHFHEVGAMDSIIDIIGVCLALESLEVDEILCSEIPTGDGMLKMAHGLYPIPAPATSEILIGVPLSGFSTKGELTTPTGAAFAKVLVDKFTTIPQCEMIKIGYGAGTSTFDHPNVLRTILLKKKS